MPKDPRRIAVLVERRYLAQAQPSGMVSALRAQGHTVVVIDPETGCYDLSNEGWWQSFDLVVARGRSWAVLCLLAWAESRGVPAINRKDAIAAVYNKAEMAVTLQRGGVPIPATLLGSAAQLARQVDGSNFPLILKPVFGDNGNGLRIVHHRKELAHLPWPEPVALAQQFLKNNGYDVKLYCMGEDVWAVRKPSQVLAIEGVAGCGLEVPDAEPELLPLTPAMKKLARQCRELFGLELFGVDCIETQDGLRVIEVNDFPNYSAVPQADERLAAYVASRARQRRPA